MLSNYLKWSLIGLILACAVAFITSDHRKVVYGQAKPALHPTLREYMDSVRESAIIEELTYRHEERKQGPTYADPWNLLR